MPEMHFRVRWPDDSTSVCYSPSSTIQEAFVLQQAYARDEFVQRSRDALLHASERVAQKYGYGCGHALAQIAEIERRARQYPPQSTVTVEAFGV